MESHDPSGEGNAPASYSSEPVAAVAPAAPVAGAVGVINVPLPVGGGALTIGVPQGAVAPVAPVEGGSVPNDLTVFFLNDALLSTFGELGQLVFDMSPPDAPKLFPNVRPAVATLLGVDLNDANAAQLVDDQLAKALDAYRRYLQVVGADLSFIEKVRVVLRDNDAPKKPIP